MNQVVRRSRKAVLDIIEIANYIAEDLPKSALAFVDAAEETLHLVSSFPSLGVAKRIPDAPVENLRMIPVAGFEQHLIFYAANDESIIVLRAIDGRREIPRLLESDGL